MVKITEWKTDCGNTKCRSCPKMTFPRNKNAEQLLRLTSVLIFKMSLRLSVEDKLR